jgi:hypothetical protein
MARNLFLRAVFAFNLNVQPTDGAWVNSQASYTIVSSVPQFCKSRIELEFLRLTDFDLSKIFVERIQDEIAL